MGSITERIDSIIAARSASLAKINAAFETVDACFEVVKNFEQLQSKIDKDAAYQQLFDKPEILERIKGISTAQFHAVYQNYKSAHAHLAERFSRKELHISFIGRAGQGKSLVMQNISGLGGNVIPSAQGTHCTGAKSIVTNNAAAVKTTARIEFFSQAEIIGIVNRYLENIFFGRYKVGSIGDIKNLPLDEMEAQLKELDVFNQLKKYVLHIGEFENHLGTTLEVAEADIEKYVAQYNSQNTGQKYFTYLGVKLANIICKFPFEDAGKIVLVDTIGIGDVSLGTESEMLDTVENDSDAIVFMFRPDVFRYYLSKEEGSFIVKVSERISREYAKEMFFLVVNRVNIGVGQNVDGMTEIYEQVNSNKYSFAKILEVDCKDPQAVKENLLMPILQQLAERGGIVDELLIERLNNLGEKLYDEYRAIADAIDKIFVGAATEDIKRALFNEIKTTYETKILDAIRTLYIKKHVIRDQTCAPWNEAAQLSRKYIFLAIPAKDRIIALLQNGTINQFNAVERCTDLMRIQIINRFMELDDVLKVLVHDTKMEAVHILADDDKGRLGKVFPLENLAPEEWIDGFIAKTDGDKKYPLLTKALTSLKNFTINVQGFLIYEVRRNLDNIDFSLQQMPEISATIADREGVAEEITSWLNYYAEQVFDGIGTTLNNLGSVPNKAEFAALKDFYDRAAYAGADETLSVTTEWRYLYEDWIPAVWSEEYKAHFAQQRHAQEWEDMTAQFKSRNKKDLFVVR